MAFANGRELAENAQRKQPQITDDQRQAFIKEIKGKIKADGFTVMHLPGDTTIPDFVYTLGRTEKQLPELVVFSTVPSGTVNMLLALVLKHQETHGVELDKELVLNINNTEIKVYLAEVPLDYMHSMVPTISNFYQNPQMVQIFMTDMEGRYPWTPDNKCLDFGQYDLRLKPFEARLKD